MTDTRRVYLLGDPVGHSLSAAFQNAAFRAAGIDGLYEARLVAAGELAEMVRRLRDDPAILGANVTVPHKVAVLPFLDRVDDEARAIGAVNIIRREGRLLIGGNTDRIGFERALAGTGFEPSGRDVLVLGRGGAARAVRAALEKSAGRIALTGRNELSNLRSAVSAADLVVNATPLGLDGISLPIPGDWLDSHHFLFDLIYNPMRTPLIKAARSRGAATSNGVAMLLHQGVKAFEMWTGAPAPEAVMWAALEQALTEVPA